MQPGRGVLLRIIARCVIAWCVAVSAVFLLSLPAAGEQSPAAARASESAKKRTARIKRFLQRSIDELDQSLFFVREDIGDIQRQIAAISFAGQPRAEEELRSLTDWHYDYESMLGTVHAAFEQDLNAYYAGSSAVTAWAIRYETLRDRHLQMKTDLAARVRRLEEERGRVEDNILLRKYKLLRLREPDWEYELRLQKEKREPKKREPREEEALIVQLEAEIRAFDQLVLQYNTLIEKTRGEQDWLSLKAGDYEALDETARVIGGSDLTAMENACKGVMRTYETDIAFLTRRIEDYDRKRSSFSRSGTLSSLDRQDELSAYYERRKSRYERQVNWLRVQIGNYRAELVDIWSDADGKRAP